MCTVVAANVRPQRALRGISRQLLRRASGAPDLQHVEPARAGARDRHAVPRLDGDEAEPGSGPCAPFGVGRSHGSSGTPNSTSGKNSVSASVAPARG